MHSRRQFLTNFGMGTATGAMLDFSLPRLAAAAFEPVRQLQPSGFTLLNNNENPYGPSPAVMAAMQNGLSAANRYPDHPYELFLDRLARLHNVSREQIVPGCGSTEILRLAVVAFLQPGKNLIVPMPTFEAIAEYAESISAKVEKVPLTSTFAHDLDQMLARADQNTALTYICNPNNPTGSLTPRKDLERFVQKLPPQTFVLIDEAYHHFANSPDYVSFIDHPVDDPRVIVARTFSKVYGMAGIRLGYGIGAGRVMEKLRRHKLQDNLNILAATAGVAGLDDIRGTERSVSRNAEVRLQFQKDAVGRGLKPIPSYANFVMLETGRPIQDLVEHFRYHQILIGRAFPPMNTYARVSLGTPEEMATFWRTWDTLPTPKAS